MRTKRDKIFDNTFNEQEFELDNRVNFVLDPVWSDNRDEEDKIQEQIVQHQIHVLINNSRFKDFVAELEDNQNKFKKIDLNEIWQFIVDEMSNEFSIIDIFSEASNYFDIHPTKFYASLSNKFKEDLVDAIDERTNILQRKNINKLF